MIYFTAHTFKCVCHCRRVMFRVLGMYNFAVCVKQLNLLSLHLVRNLLIPLWAYNIEINLLKCSKLFKKDLANLFILHIVALTRAKQLTN